MPAELGHYRGRGGKKQEGYGGRKGADRQRDGEEERGAKRWEKDKRLCDERRGREEEVQMKNSG